MCGRYTLASGEQILEVVPNVTIKEDLRTNIPLWSGRWNIAPSQDILVVANREEVGHLLAEPMRWGLVPSWAKDPSIGNKMINARAETLPTKPAFRKALERRRCIIPADGFYEWRKLADPFAKTGGGAKQPLYIHMKDGHAFAFAGLWETWRDENGGLLKSCTVITTQPNELMSTIHDRMPVILPREAILDWLDPKPRDPDEIATWLKPYPADEMEAIPVSCAVNSPKNEGPDLIKCVASPADEDTKEPPAPPPKARSISPRTRKADDQQGSLF